MAVMVLGQSSRALLSSEANSPPQAPPEGRQRQKKEKEKGKGALCFDLSARMGR